MMTAGFKAQGIASVLTTGFSVQGSSLKLMRSHERGVVTRIKSLGETATQRLKALGITLGQSITVEQRAPRFIVRVGNDCHTLDEAVVGAIYVRIVEC